MTNSQATEGLPRYLVVRESLREEIHTRFKPGEKLSPEPELMKAFGVSRITIRHALEQLRTEGLITRVQGKGTFVAYPTIHPDLHVLRSFTEDIKAAGQRPGTAVISVRPVVGSPRACELLGVAPKTKLVLIEKVRLADNVPISFEVSYLPKEIATGWSAELIEHRPIFDLIAEVSGIHLSRGKLEISAASAPSRIAKVLHVPSGSPVLQVERITYSEEHRPIDYDILYLRADRVRYTFEPSGRRGVGRAQESALRLLVSDARRVASGVQV